MPLSIELRIEKVAEGLVPVQHILLKEISRWKSLKIDTARCMYIGRFLQAIGKSAPKLQAISIHVGHNGSWWQYENPINRLEDPRNRFSGSPHLRTVGINRNIIATTGTGSLHGLISHLSLGYTTEQYTGMRSADALAQLLQELPRLESLYMDVPLSNEDLGGPEVDMMNLQSLTLTGSDKLFAFLSRIRASNLTRLAISRSVDDLNALSEKWLLDFLKLSN